MGHVERRDAGRWRARYRDPAGKERSRTFSRKSDAERFLVTVETSKMAGNYIDPAASRRTVGEQAAEWLAGQAHLTPATRARYAGIVREHIVPRWGTTRLANVRHGDVQSWVSTLTVTRSPATVRKISGVLALMLDLAVKDERLARNPAAGVNLPRVAVTERRYLTHGQVDALAQACASPDPDRLSKHRRHDEQRADELGLAVRFLAYTGVRFGEMAALRVGRLDLMRRRASIVESVTVVQGAGQVWGAPKGHERREVPIPRFLVDDLSAHVAGKAPTDLVFTGVRGGGALRAAVFRRGGFDRAAHEIGIPGLHPHELRHTAASLAIAAGANVKVVQQMLGHKDAAMTLNQYGHLFGDQLDDVADAMDAARTSQVPATRVPAAVVRLDLAR